VKKVVTPRRREIPPSGYYWDIFNWRGLQLNDQSPHSGLFHFLALSADATSETHLLNQIVQIVVENGSKHFGLGQVSQALNLDG